jgi:hypothetical protein
VGEPCPAWKEVIIMDPIDVIKLIAAIAGVITSAKSAIKYAHRLGLI